MNIEQFATIIAIILFVLSGPICQYVMIQQAVQNFDQDVIQGLTGYVTFYLTWFTPFLISYVKGDLLRTIFILSGLLCQYILVGLAYNACEIDDSKMKTIQGLTGYVTLYITILLFVFTIRVVLKI